MAARAAFGRFVNAGPTAERVYETLKRSIMERGFRPGDRLDPVVLAERLNSSTTPVREALDRLVGEDLVVSRTAGGFFLPALDEPGLKDMYGWCAELLALAIRHSRGSPVARPSPTVEAADSEDQPLPERTARLFAGIAQGSANSEHARAVERLNVRIHAIRTVEPLVLDDAEAELDALETILRNDDRAGLRRWFGSYHRRRVRAAASILRALYRAG